MKSRKIAYCRRLCLCFVAFGSIFQVTNVNASGQDSITLKVDRHQVQVWNNFAERLYTLQKYQLAQEKVETTTSLGGYAHQKNLYIETRYYETQGHRLLGQIQRLNNNSNAIMEIEVYIYDKHARLVRDYLAAYLPFNRNAPIQTLINLHAYHGGLHAYRQFDASGERIYEQCEGTYHGKKVMLSLEEDEFTPGPGADNKTLKSTVYRICFDGIAMSAQAYLNPLHEIKLATATHKHDIQTGSDEYEKQIEVYNAALKREPRNTDMLIRRGDAYFQLGQFELAIEDYSDAIDIDPHADKAYFGRGMALGRYGQIREGIKDLSVYIRRHPNESHAFTKRGVRYLWIKDEKKAEKDFQRAIHLDPRNSEAHDDLGVIHARRGDYVGALKHFNAAIKYDPTYFKAFHNQAVVYYITGHDSLALDAVEQALSLVPDQRNSVLLKAKILKHLGQDAEAERVKSDAEFLPEGNWSERLPVR